MVLNATFNNISVISCSDTVISFMVRIKKIPVTRNINLSMDSSVCILKYLLFFGVLFCFSAFK